VKTVLAQVTAAVPTGAAAAPLAGGWWHAMTADTAVAPDSIDDVVDDEIAKCLDLSAPISFFLFAGAGSGKTRSLVTALRYVQERLSAQLRSRGQRVAVITYHQCGKRRDQEAPFARPAHRSTNDS